MVIVGDFEHQTGDIAGVVHRLFAGRADDWTAVI